MAPVEAQLRDDIKTHLEKVMEALEAHPLWSEKPPSLFFLWDFVNTGVSMLAEYDNILNGHPLQNPDRVRPAPRARAIRHHGFTKDNVKQAVKNLEAVVPKQHLLAGMMN